MSIAGKPGPSGEDNTALAFRVEGMDCASCAAKIETALSRLPGVSEIKVSVSREMLKLSLDAGSTSAHDVENIVTRLGYKTSRIDDAAAPPAPVSGGHCCGHDHDHHHDHEADHGHDHAGPAKKPDEHAGHSHGPADGKTWWQGRKARETLFSAVMIAVAYLVSLTVPAWGDVIFAVATLTMVFPIAGSAFTAARLGAFFTIEMLMTIAAIGAVIIGESEEAAIVVLLFSIGEVLEGVAAEKARSGIRALGALIPKTALIEQNGALVEIAASDIAIGQVVVSRPGERIPADGVVIDGISGVDESPVTGESVPVQRTEGARVFAGSINLDAALRIRVDRAPEDNTIARIVALVEEAQDSRAPTERFIDRFSRYYMPAIVAVAATTAILPPLLGYGTWEMWTYRALALLLIGCPCALVISVPAAIASSLSAAARKGMLVKGGAVIEVLANTQVVAFDKTGTLTLGQPSVTDIVALDGDMTRLIARASAIEAESGHPLAQAVVRYATAQNIAPVTATGTRAIPGKGMEGSIDGQTVFIGAPLHAAERGDVPQDLLAKIEALENEGKSIAVIMSQGRTEGVIALRDEPRPDAARAIAALSKEGIRSIMLSGDNQRTADAIGGKLGLTARAGLLPADKVAHIRELASQGTVVMVGDGINDAPALAAASVGIAIGSGTDVALEAADAALMRNDVGDVARLIRLSRATMSNIRQNVTIALGLKAIFLVTTITGVSDLWLAVFADTGATVLVTANAMRLLGFFRGEKDRTGA